jgi:signal peptidase I
MAQFDTVQTQGELSAPGAAKKRSRSVWGLIFRIFWIALFVLILAVSGQVIYDYTRYRSFFVSGDSMYPTLNKDATSTLHPNQVNDGTWGNFDAVGEYVCDYGLSDTSEGFLAKLQRFDIVVAHYDDDVSDSYPSTHDTANMWKLGHEAVIKRLIAFPGESLYFDAAGALHLKEVGAVDYAIVDQPATIVNDTDSKGNSVIAQTASIAAISKVSAGQFYGSEASPCVLGEGEYFLTGDNRRVGCSTDSRQKGPLGHKHTVDSRYPSGSELIQGLAVAIVAKRKVVIAPTSSSASPKTYWVAGSNRMPWDIRYLGPSGEAMARVASLSSSTSQGLLYAYMRREECPR